MVADDDNEVEDYWVVDSGSSSHITNDDKILTHLRSWIPAHGGRLLID